MSTTPAYALVILMTHMGPGTAPIMHDRRGALRRLDDQSPP
jgi:hypothetical protein